MTIHIKSMRKDNSQQFKNQQDDKYECVTRQEIQTLQDKKVKLNKKKNKKLARQERKNQGD